MHKDFSLKQWVVDRDNAACSFDVAEFKKFYNKYAKMGVYPGVIDLPSDEVLEVTMRKMVLAMANPPADKYSEACEWLIAHGCDLEV